MKVGMQAASCNQLITRAQVLKMRTLPFHVSLWASAEIKFLDGNSKKYHAVFTLASLEPMTDFNFLKRDDWGIKITTVHCFLQGKGIILCNADWAVNGVKVLLTLVRPSSWICKYNHSYVTYRKNFQKTYFCQSEW